MSGFATQLYLLMRRRAMMAQGGGGDIDYTLLPLTFKCRTGGDLSIKNENTSYDRNFEYSLNNGAWTAFSLPANSGVLLIATLSPGDTISFRRDNDDFYQAQFVSDSSLTFDIYGNLLSLQYGSAFNGQTTLRNTSKQAFGYTFKGTNVVDASNLKLTATTLSVGCYQAMFQGCALLESAPELPATTVAHNCYRSMFAQCSNLVNAPSILPATDAWRTECYRAMFFDCTSLVNAPELSATRLGQGSCYQMFYNCVSLVNAPTILHATSLVLETYFQMFRNCSSLVTAPAILATTAAGGKSCQRMFMGCSSLNYVKCLLTNRTGTDVTFEWLNGVAATGTFVKAAGATWESGISGIPTGWTVIDATD